MMKLSPKFTTVTPLSKTLAIILFLILPFIGFSLGIKYGKLKSTQDSSQSLQIEPTLTPTIPLSQPLKKYQDWNIFYNQIYSIQYPSEYITSKDLEKIKTPEQSAFLTKYPKADIKQKEKEEDRDIRIIEKGKIKKDTDVDRQPWELGIYISEKKDLSKTFPKKFIPQSNLDQNPYLEIHSEDEFFDKNSVFRKSLRTENGNGGIGIITYETVNINNTKALKQQTVWTHTNTGFEGTDVIYYIFGKGEFSSKVIAIYYSTELGETNIIPEKMISSFFLRENY